MVILEADNKKQSRMTKCHPNTNLNNDILIDYQSNLVQQNQYRKHPLS